MFTGPAGVGKSATAVEAAKVIRCEAPSDGAACDECENCRSVLALHDPGVQLIFPLPSGKNESSRSDGPFDRLSEENLETIREEVDLKARNPYHHISVPKAQQIKISSVRQIRRDTSKSADARGWRVFVILDAEKMRKEAANAFLKTLEEPAPRTLTILVTSDPARLLPTIRSRCQQVQFAPLTEIDIANGLTQRCQADEAEAQLVARLSGGSFSRAIDLLGSELQQSRSDAVDFLRGVLRRSPVAAAEQIERLASIGDRNELDRFLELLELWLRDAMVLGLSQSDDLVVNRDQIEDLRRFVERFGDAPLQQLAPAVETTRRMIRRNVQPRLALTSLSMNLERMCYGKA
jgi:DNA polymerase-3 subunit delta'